MSSPSAPAPTSPVVIRISPMAHIAAGFLALGILALAPTNPALFIPLLVIPLLVSAVIARNRTTADRQEVIARTLLSSQRLDWDDIEGLRFGRGASAFAQRKDGGEVKLPAVTFSTLPLLAEVSGGRVPNPYA